MLKKGQQRAYFNEVWESMLAHLLAFCEARDSEELHQLRVQVKKVKAMLLFLQDGPPSRQLKSLQSIFKHAGLIRSAYINLQLIGQYQLTYANFINEQEKIVEKETRRFYRKRGAYIKALKKAQPVLAGHFHDVDNKFIVRLYKKRLNNLSRFFAASNPRPDQLHKKRKKIKNLLYLYDVQPDSIVRKLQLDTTYLDKLQDAIGNWHDVVVIVELLKKKRVFDEKTMERLDRRSARLLASVGTLTDDFAKKAVLS